MKHKPGPLFRDEFFGAPYKLGGQSKEEGFDCVSFVERYSRELGSEIPDFSDLYSMFDDKPGEAFKVMWKRLFKASEKIPPGRITPGDIAVVKIDGDSYPSIYMGNNLIALSDLDEGVTVCNLDDFELIDVRRLDSSNG
jgi:cell wall-associated NlpC family hydrolase